MLDRLMGGAIMAAMSIAATPPANAAPVQRFACSVKGAGLIKPGLDVSAICAQVKAGVDTALTTTTTTVAKAPEAARDTDGWVSVAIRISKPGIVSVIVTRASGGQIVVHPETLIAQSDRSIDAATIEQLVAEVSRILR